MIKLNFDSFRDKIHACWVGKNIGGTMGGPFEGKRELLNITGYTTPKDTVLPNDDLDLQLVWLMALERTGARHLDAKRLGEYWLSYITPHWNEYGICMANMQAGLLPPLCGDYKNGWKHSNGAWIRTEIWACLSPGCPDIAVKYAYEDACVDHGNGEGTIAAIFVAALESAAFIETDIIKLINIGLSKIPENSRVARSIRLLIKCYKEGMAWQDARNAILNENMDIGDGWFEAPSNVAYAVLGLLYGECDFKKSMLTAINCGDDTDCTAATVGSILGIMYGSKCIPDDWRDHIGDSIVTISIAKGVLLGVPETCSELTERIIAQMPHFIADSVLAPQPLPVILHSGEDEIPESDCEALLNSEFALSLANRPEYSFTQKLTYAVTATVIFEKEPTVKPNESIDITLHLENDSVLGTVPYTLKLNWILPDGWSVAGTTSALLPQTTCRDANPALDLNFTVTAGDCVESVNDLILKIDMLGSPIKSLIPITVMG